MPATGNAASTSRGRVGCLLVVGLALLVGAATPPASAWERMSVDMLSRLSDEEWLNWAMRQVGPYLGDIATSASGNGVPPRLVAACILNELGDYDLKDQLVDENIPTSGSTGLAHPGWAARRARRADRGPGRRGTPGLRRPRTTKASW